VLTSYDDRETLVAPPEAPELAILDPDGVILSVNSSWLRFARENDAVLTVTGEPETLPAEVVDELVQVITEAMSNVARHSGARTTQVRLEVAPDGSWQVLIADDGRGFDPATTPRGQGLANMAARAALMDATLTVRPSPGHGTEILVRPGRSDTGPSPSPGERAIAAGSTQ
jgi:nitrate/nitrite-specific signal transduction histidine kinase